ncbi:MAG: DUF2914 domain-containing protein [Gammaproteobacteria bacterium]|nr:DUF2914 domain-containing protein [Gammaproteobacteria bacterium]
MKILTYIIFLLLVSFSGLTNAEENIMPMKQGKIPGQINHTESVTEAMPVDVEMDSAEKAHESIPVETDSNEKEITNDIIANDLEGFSRGSVVRSIFTSAIEDREPADQVKELANNHDNIIYYTELRDMVGQVAKHRWEYNGEVMAEVEFNVKGQRWRVWSSKSFVPQWTGEWKVSVLNGANEVISEDILTYAAATETTTDSTPVTDSSAVEESTSSAH